MSAECAVTKPALILEKYGEASREQQVNREGTVQIREDDVEVLGAAGQDLAGEEAVTEDMIDDVDIFGEPVCQPERPC